MLRQMLSSVLSGMVRFGSVGEPVDPDVVIERTAHGTVIIGIDLPHGVAMEKYPLPTSNANGWRLRIFARPSEVETVKRRLALAVEKMGESHARPNH